MRFEIDEVVWRKDASGRLKAAPNVPVQVNVHGAGAATVYAELSGGSTLANPLATDSAGRVEGWLEEGDYDLVVGVGAQQYTQRFRTPATGATGARGPQGVPGLSGGLVFNVKDEPYGAVGENDPADNDQDAINAAIYDAHLQYLASGSRQTVYLPAGRYYVSVPVDRYTYFPGAAFGGFIGIFMRPGVHLLANRDAKLTGPKGDQEYLLTVVPTGTADPVPHATEMGGDDWAITGVVFEPGDGAGAEVNGGGIALGASADWAITDCIGRDMRGDFCVALGAADGSTAPARFRFERNDTSSMGGQTLITYTSGVPVEDGIVDGNTVRDPYVRAEAFAFTGSGGAAVKSERLQFTNNKSFEAGNVVITDTKGLLAEGNTVISHADDQSSPFGFSGEDILIKGNLFDASAITFHGNNGPLRAEGPSSNVTITGGNVLKQAWGGSLFGTGSDYTVVGNIFVTTVASTDVANSAALNMGQIDGGTVGPNRFKGAGTYNSIIVGDDFTVIGNSFGGTGHIQTGDRCTVLGNTGISAPANASRPGWTHRAIEVGADSLVQTNGLSAGVDEGAIFMAGPRTTAQNNIIKNTVLNGLYVFGDHDDNNALDNIVVATAAVTGTGYGGFAGARSVVRKLVGPAAYTISNVTPDRSLDADATTTAELADAFGTLVADLRAAGIAIS